MKANVFMFLKLEVVTDIWINVGAFSYYKKSFS